MLYLAIGTGEALIVGIPCAKLLTANGRGPQQNLYIYITNAPSIKVTLPGRGISEGYR